MLRTLLGDSYDKKIKESLGEEIDGEYEYEYDWDEGIAP